MRAERITRRQLERARVLMNRRDPAVSRAARRALGSAAIVLEGLRTKGELQPYIEAALRASIILASLEHRARRKGDRRRARKLAAAARPAASDVTDLEFAAAWSASGGRVRATARTLGLSPSTVSRRSVALRDGMQHPLQCIPRRRRSA